MTRPAPLDSHGMPIAIRDPERPVYLRIGTWNPCHPYSRNYAGGEQETGLSVYALKNDQPVAPTRSEWAEDDLRDRLASDDPKFLVQGHPVGQGHDGEPLLCHVAVVGLWNGEDGS